MTPENGEIFQERDALYYPYIHIRDVDWLKRTLLVFPHLVRMVPEKYIPHDDPFVARLSGSQTKRGSLLKPADLKTAGVAAAQDELQRNLEADLEREGQAFIMRYGEAAADVLKKDPGDPGFQLHPGKMRDDPFLEFLRTKGLAWQPANPDDSQYVEVHPRIGQAVLSALAVACAEDEGLEIVTDPNDEESRWLNLTLASRGRSEVYNAWIHPKEIARSAKTASARAILELIAYHHANMDKVTPERLVELSDDREALAKLKSALKRMAASIPPMMNDERLRERLEEQVQEVLRRWKADRLNMSSVSKEIFGTQGLENVGDFMKKLAEKVMSPEIWGGTLSGTIAKLSVDPFLGAAAGFGVGVVIHVVSAVKRARTREKESLFRYLTILEDAGVAFTVGQTEA
jgi:hypothetical protein